MLCSSSLLQSLYSFFDSTNNCGSVLTIVTRIIYPYYCNLISLLQQRPTYSYHINLNNLQDSMLGKSPPGI